MTDREELRRLIDVIEKASGSGSVEQAVDDIKTFANTVSFLANKLDARLKSKDVAAKKPKSRIGKAIAAPPFPKPNVPQQQSTAKSIASGMPSAVSSSTSQADYDRLKPQGAQGADERYIRYLVSMSAYAGAVGSDQVLLVVRVASN